MIDAATGELVRTFEIGFDSYSTLSPDGRYLSVSTFDDETFQQNLSVYDLATGELADLGELSGAQDLGWTAAGDAFAVSRACSRRATSTPATARSATSICRRTPSSSSAAGPTSPDPPSLVEVR